jgi:hypothetical protein
MKSQIVSVILFCIALPWIVARVFQMEGHHETLQENGHERGDRSRPVPAGSYLETKGQQVTYDELSNKQINYLIP